MEIKVSSVLEENLQQLKQLFGSDASFKIHRFQAILRKSTFSPIIPQSYHKMNAYTTPKMLYFR